MSTSKPTPPAKPPTPSKVIAALTVVAESYEHRRTTALAALRGREAEIAARFHTIVDTIETSLAVPEGEPDLSALLGAEPIAAYVRAASASRGIAAIVAAESGAPPTAAATDVTSSSPKTAAPAASKPTEPGTVSLAGPNKWNFGALRKTALAAAAVAGWPTDKLAAFTATLAAAKKHVQVLDAVRASGLTVVE